MLNSAGDNIGRTLLASGCFAYRPHSGLVSGMLLEGYLQWWSQGLVEVWEDATDAFRGAVRVNYSAGFRGFLSISEGLSSTVLYERVCVHLCNMYTV